MTDSERPQNQINYWLVPVSGIFIFLASQIGFLTLICLAGSRGYFNHDDFCFFGESQFAIPVAYIAISGILAAIPTMTTLSWEPKAISLLTKQRKET